MIKILRFTEYLYLLVAIMAAYKIITTWGQPDQPLALMGVFLLVSVGMFFFRRNYRKKFEQRQRDNNPY
jgi:positive regulator of sigma E activity